MSAAAERKRKRVPSLPPVVYDVSSFSRGADGATMVTPLLLLYIQYVVLILSFLIIGNFVCSIPTIVN